MACGHSIITFFRCCYCCACHYQLNKILENVSRNAHSVKKSNTSVSVGRWREPAQNTTFFCYSSWLFPLLPALSVYFLKTHAICVVACHRNINQPVTSCTSAAFIALWPIEICVINKFEIRSNVRELRCDTTIVVQNVALCISVAGFSTCFVWSVGRWNLVSASAERAVCVCHAPSTKNSLPELTAVNRKHRERIRK